MLALVVRDIHLTDRPPSSCTDTYLDDLFDLLGHVGRLGEIAKINVEVWAGDTFHYKAPSRTSHELVARAADVIKSRPWPVEILLGNHDIRNDRTDSMDKQPIGMLIRAGAHLLDGWAAEMYQDDERREYGMLPLYGVPWIQGYGDKSVSDEEMYARVWAAMAEWREQFDRGWGNEHPLLVTHAPLYPPSRELEYEFFSASDWAACMGGAGACAYGHVHEAHGTWTAGGVNPVVFSNDGALSRGSLHESELTREVAVTLYDSRTGEFRRVPLPQKPASEVFRLVEAKEMKDAQQSLDAFLDAVGHSTLSVTSAEAVVAKLQEMDIERKEEILALSRRLLDEVK